MRRSLLLTAAAAISMVLLAMLVPMAILVRSYALEDRLARAALEVQAVETVVSGQDAGAVGQYVDRLNDAEPHTQVTVLYPDGLEIGPDRGQDELVLDARNTGRARVDDVAGGSQILVPVSRGGNSALPSQTPVIRVVVDEPGITSVVGVAWGLLAVLALALLAGIAGGRRPPRPVVRHAHPPARRAHADARPPGRRHPGRGHRRAARGAGARRRRRTPHRPHPAVARPRAGERRRPLPPPADPRHRAAAARRDRRRPGPARPPGRRPRRAAGHRRRDRPRGPSLRARGPRPAHRRGRGRRRACPPLGGAGRGPGPRLRPAPRRVRAAAAGQPRRPGGAGRRAARQRLLPHPRRRRRDVSRWTPPTTWSSSSWRTPVPACPPASTRRVAARAARGRPAWASPSPRAPPRTPAARSPRVPRTWEEPGSPSRCGRTDPGSCRRPRLRPRRPSRSRHRRRPGSP